MEQSGTLASSKAPVSPEAPAPDDDILSCIEQESPELSSSLRAVADFLLVEGTGLVDDPMQQLAQLTYTSKPTLVRFAQHFGYRGWKEFRADFLRAAAAREHRASTEAAVDLNYPFGVQDQPEQIARSVAAIHAVTVEYLQQSAPVDQLVRAARTILSARRVLFLGNPPNRCFGEIFAFNVSELEIDCRVPHNETVDQELRLLDQRDCVIAASYSGSLTRGSLKYLHLARDRGAAIIGITAKGSPLDAVSDIALAYEPREHYYSKVAGYFGCACVQVMLDMLHALCYAAHYEDNTATRLQRAALWSRNLHISDTL